MVGRRSLARSPRSHARHDEPRRHEDRRRGGMARRVSVECRRPTREVARREERGGEGRAHMANGSTSGEETRRARESDRWITEERNIVDAAGVTARRARTVLTLWRVL